MTSNTFLSLYPVQCNFGTKQQYTESIETRPSKVTKTSFKTFSTKLILVTPNAEGITLLKALFSLLYPKLFQLEYKPYHSEPERNCHKNHATKLIRLFLWVAQMHTASLSIFQFVWSLPKSHSKLIQFHWIYSNNWNIVLILVIGDMNPMSYNDAQTLSTSLLVGVKVFAKHQNK